ncbi:MAG: N-acyl homoserine lactonase family protein [Solirubrobacteraceae bacterium]
MRLYVLSLGESEVDKGVMLTPGIDEGVWVPTPVPAYLVETDDGRRVLIDTGLHPGHIADPGMTWRGTPMDSILHPTMRQEHTLEHQLGLIDLTVEDLTDVVISHLHFDHCGQLFALAGKRVLICAEHLAAARRDPQSFRPAYFELPELRYEPGALSGEIFPGIEAIETPGHAPHHRSFLIELPRTGPVVLAIDAILSRHQLALGAWGDQADPESAARSGRRLAELARERDATLLFGHDPEQWASIRHAPDFYD